MQGGGITIKDEIQIGFVGNPNCGKTTLFNAFTGARLKVANWPGVTVEKKEGVFQKQNMLFRLVDLPGIYSLTSYTMEEKLSREYILHSGVDVIINVVDASNLERNLYLTLQLIELGKPVVMALNMMDIVEERGMKLNLSALKERLGIPVVPVSARKRSGLEELITTVEACRRRQCCIDTELNKAPLHKSRLPTYDHNAYDRLIGFHDKPTGFYSPSIIYSRNIEEKISEISTLLRARYSSLENLRWHAMKIMELDEDILAERPIDLKGIVKHSYEEELINEKYNLIEHIIQEVLVNKARVTAATDQADRILTHRYFGLPIFLGIMVLVFFLTFEVGGIFKSGCELLLRQFSDAIICFLKSIHAGEFITSLLVEGIIAGVGGILSFLPNIFFLFLALAYLEDSGYMARVAYVMEGIMGKLGLSGKAFIPMLLGFGCTVPAIMASRSLENMKDRRKTILITPFMSCSARLTVYVLFSQMFFTSYAMWVAFSMYLIGILTAILTAYFLNDKTNQPSGSNLLIELPEYKLPNAHTIFIYVWEKVKEYLTKAGTTIFAASVVIWFVLNFNSQGMVEDMSLSFGAGIGRAVAPVLKPAGLGMWQVVVALIAGIAAKEVVVSSFGVLFSVPHIASPAGRTALADVLGQYGFGALNAYSLMVFCLLYIPCVATIGVIRREMRSMKWTIITILFQLGLAMLASTFIYQVGRLFRVS